MKTAMKIDSIRESAQESVRPDMEQLVLRAQEKRQGFIQKIREGTEMGFLTALAWAAEEAEAQQVAWYASMVLARLDHEDSDELPWDALAVIAEKARDALLEDQYRGGSTSHFSNAVEHAQRAGAARFLRIVDRTLRLRESARQEPKV